MVVNNPDWGLANEVLPEWQASPRLVQVNTSEIEERRFGNAFDAAENAQRTLREKASEAETAPAAARSDLQLAQASLEVAAREQATLRAALRKAQRAHDAERTALEAALHEAQVAQRSEAVLRRELEAMLGSTIWRASAPLRMAAGKLPSSLRTTARTGLRAVYWVLTPWDTPKRIRFLRERYRQGPVEAALEAPPIDGRTDAPSSNVPEIDFAESRTGTGACPEERGHQIVDRLRIRRAGYARTSISGCPIRRGRRGQRLQRRLDAWGRAAAADWRTLLR